MCLVKRVRCAPASLLSPFLSSSLRLSFLQSQQEESGSAWERLHENTFLAGAKLMGYRCCVMERSHSATNSAKLLSAGLRSQTDREEVAVSHREAPAVPLLITSLHSPSTHTLSMPDHPLLCFPLCSASFLPFMSLCC